MKIINEDYAYDTDSYNFILLKAKNTDKKGVDRYTQIGFYSSLRGLLKSLVNKVAKEEIKDLTELDRKLTELKDWIDQNVVNDAGN